MGGLEKILLFNHPFPRPLRGFLLFFGGSFGGFRSVFLNFFADSTALVKAVNAARRINDTLFAGIERVAVGAQIESHNRHGRVGENFAATRGAGDRRFDVIGVDSRFHRWFFLGCSGLGTRKFRGLTSLNGIRFVARNGASLERLAPFFAVSVLLFWTLFYLSTFQRAT
jgi:hypothetical protein